VSIRLPAPKPCIFVGSSRKDLLGFPPPVRRNIGHAPHEVQSGGEPLSAKALKGFGGRTILEVIDDFDATPSGLFTQYVLLTWFTFFTRFRRNQKEASLPRSAR
jgi:phage-related protein